MLHQFLSMDNLQKLCMLITFGCLQAASAPTCPSNICTCQQLEIASRMETEVLCNSDRNIGYVPVFRTFSSSISSLYLNKVELTVLGNETFRELSTIREVYLNDNYLIRIETRAFAVIDHSIELLDLQHNKLRELTFLTTHDFSRLRELLLRDNQLASISPGSFMLMPSLETLNLDDNSLTGPLTFLRQPSLKALLNLNLDANQLTAINPEDFLYLTNLRSLLVNRNQLRNLTFLNHHIFKQLQGISAASNQLTNIDASLFANKHLLRWIDLSSNGLTNVSFLSSCSLQKLEEIYLSANLLTSIPTDSFQATSYLSVFVADNNQLQTLPHCALSRFYARLQTFDISNNPMRCDCELSWLQMPHSIATERQSECVNLEFASTGDYQPNHCSDPDPCVVGDACRAQGADLGYDSFNDDNLQQEYAYTTKLLNNGAGGPRIHLVLYLTLLSLVVISPV